MLECMPPERYSKQDMIDAIRAHMNRIAQSGHELGLRFGGLLATTEASYQLRGQSNSNNMMDHWQFPAHCHLAEKA